MWKELQSHQVPRSSSILSLSLSLLPVPVGFALIREANRVWPPRASLNVRNRSQATLKIVEGSEVGGCERANNQPLRLLCLLRWKVINYGLANSEEREKERGRRRGRNFWIVPAPFRSIRSRNFFFRPLKTKPTTPSPSPLPRVAPWPRSLGGGLSPRHQGRTFPWQ